MRRCVARCTSLLPAHSGSTRRYVRGAAAHTRRYVRGTVHASLRASRGAVRALKKRDWLPGAWAGLLQQMSQPEREAFLAEAGSPQLEEVHAV